MRLYSRSNFKEQITQKLKNQDQTRLFGKIKEETV